MKHTITATDSSGKKRCIASYPSRDELDLAYTSLAEILGEKDGAKHQLNVLTAVGDGGETIIFSAVTEL